MLCIQRFCRANVAGLGHQLMPPMVAAGLHINCGARALVNDNIFHRGTRLQRFLDRGEQLDLSAAAVGTILGYDRGGLRVVNAINKRVGREPAENHGGFVFSAPAIAQKIDRDNRLRRAASKG